MRRIIPVFLLSASVLATGCFRRDVYPDHTGVRLELDIDTSFVNSHVTPDDIPEHMVASFYDVRTGKLAATDFVEPDGGFLHLSPGQYDMLVYNYSGRAVRVQSPAVYRGAEAYTLPVSKSIAKSFAWTKDGSKSVPDPGTYTYTPDYFFVASGRVDVPVSMDGDRVFVIPATAESLVETWDISLGPVENIQYVDEVSAAISGMVRSRMLWDGSRSEEDVVMVFDMVPDVRSGMFRARFNTFGRNAYSEARFYVLSVNVKDSSDKDYHFEYDVSDLFRDNAAQSIVIRDTIEVRPATGGGGIVPEVGNWDDVHRDIDL